MGYFEIISIPFDVLDAAFAEKLSYFPNGYVDFIREGITGSSVIYKLSQEQLGQVGEIRIRKINNSQSELFVKDPGLESIRALTKDEKLSLKTANNQDEYSNLHAKLFKKLVEEKNDLRKRRIRHLTELSRSVLTKIENDTVNFEISNQTILSKCLDEFGLFISSEMRMSFWQKKNAKHEWINYPERHAKQLLRSYLAGRYGLNFRIFEEINAGAGRIDIYIVTLQNEKAIIELKMCGNRYSRNYAKHGIKQLVHYMQNKDVHNGYLLIFDSRQKDFSSGFDANENEITTQFIDVRYNL